MDVPSRDHPVWSRLVQGQVQHDLDFLAAKIFLGHAIVKIKTTPDPDIIKRYAYELWQLFNQNAPLPSVQSDLQKMLAEEGAPS